MLKGKTISIVGYGNMGQVWAANLRDSGFEPLVFTRKPIDAEGAFYSLKELSQKKHDLLLLLIPDHQHCAFFQEYASDLTADFIIYNHGYSLHFEKVQQLLPNAEHLLLAAKSIAQEMRTSYLQKKKIPFVFSSELAIKTSYANELLKELAQSLGSQGAVYPTTLREETVADLFSEQALLCSFPYLLKEAFSLMRQNDISQNIAALELWHEFKLIIATIDKIGFTNFFEAISPAALVGSYHAQEKLYDHDFQKKMKDLMVRINEGSFHEGLKNSDFEKIRQTIRQEWQDFPLNNNAEGNHE